MLDQETKKHITEIAIVLAIAAIVVATFGLSGCASNVERSFSQCLVLGGNAAYIEAHDIRRVSCVQ